MVPVEKYTHTHTDNYNTPSSSHTVGNNNNNYYLLIQFIYWLTFKI